MKNKADEQESVKIHNTLGTTDGRENPESEQIFSLNHVKTMSMADQLRVARDRERRGLKNEAAAIRANVADLFMAATQHGGVN